MHARAPAVVSSSCLLLLAFRNRMPTDVVASRQRELLLLRVADRRRVDRGAVSCNVSAAWVCEILQM